MNPELSLAQIRTTRIITVMRGDFPPDNAIAVCEVLLGEGLNIVELTYNSPDWREALPAVLEAFKDTDLLVGMGTVLNPAQVNEALDLGAQFLVSPALNPASVSTAHAAGVLMAPGIATPTEAAVAASYGCKLLKLFPADPLGLAYFKTMRSALDSFDFTCNGNMHTGNIGDFLAAGATACGLAGNGLAGNGNRPLSEIKAIAQDVAAIVKDAAPLA
ncbi:bifunctional 4-hydroxy-2-oxoglutarate aldolase/2-dehydro-3-deoxy-phosphogluconate aldolase [Chloroflexota bacterium]